MKPRIMLPFFVLALVLQIPAYAAPSGSCTVTGSKDRDFLSGKNGADVICGFGAKDFLSGRDGVDRLRADGGPDTLVGGDGRDVLRGRRGKDYLFAVDGAGGDVVDGGPGFDRCYGEKHDRFKRCERVSTNKSPTYPLRVAEALSNALAQSVAVAQVETKDDDEDCGLPVCI